MANKILYSKMNLLNRFGNLLLVSTLVFNYNNVQAQSEHGALLEGTNAYKKGDFETATKGFEKALEQNSSSIKGNFNLGNSLYKRQQYDEAATYFQNAANSAKDNTLKSQALYNLGNSHLAKVQQATQNQGDNPPPLSEENQKKLESAIDAYKNTLRLNSKDYDAKNNLAVAYKLLRQQQQQQQQNQQKNQDKNEENKNQDKKEQPQDPKNQPPKDDPNKPIDNDNKPANSEPQELKKNEVDKLMDVIEQEDKKVQEKLLKRKRPQTTKSDKEW